MTNLNQLNDCLAIDCNLESYSSLSSSSSTSSSTTSLSSSNKNANEDDLDKTCSKTNFSIANTVVELVTHNDNDKNNGNKFDSETSSSKFLVKNKKLNSLIHGTRRNTQQKNKNKNLKFASVESLSCDEGYVGSYSDTTNSLTTQPPPSVNTHESNDKAALSHNNLNRLLSPHDQLELLKFLLEHTFDVILEDQASSALDSREEKQEEGVPPPLDDVKTNKEENTFLIPPIYTSSNTNSNVPEFEHLLNPLKCTDSNYQSELFDIGGDAPPVGEIQQQAKCNSMQNICSNEFSSSFENDYSWTFINTDLSKCEKLRVIQEEINRLKDEQERMDEEEMMTSKWRFILERKRRLELRKNELLREDEIDAQAYLNEIEMNLDYFTHEGLVSDMEDINFSMDQMLRFKTNTMAFNLRNYHKHVSDQQVIKSHM
jgi:hypothetical protein